MPRLLHGFLQRHALTGGLVRYPTAARRREFLCVQPGDTHRRFTIRLIDCGVSAFSSTPSQRRSPEKHRPLGDIRTLQPLRSASTGGPTYRSTLPASSATPVFVRPSWIATQGKVGDSRIEGIERHRRLIACDLSTRRRATSLRRAAAGGEGQRQNSEIAGIGEPVRSAGRQQTIQDVTRQSALALALPRPDMVARTASRSAERRPGDEKGPPSPFQRCSVPQLDNRLFTVDGDGSVGANSSA